MKLSYESRNGKPRSRKFKTNSGAKATNRRKVALENLQKQLLSGKKQGNEPLSESDITRINSEIQTLKGRI